MKRCLLFGLSLLAVAFVARAEKVSPQQAAAVAERFLAVESMPSTKSAQGTVRLTGTWPDVQTKGESQAPALYLFEREGGGYVVVAADDVSLPVIGYSTSGRLPLDRLPANLRFMLDWHAAMIDYARREGLEADAATKAQWLSAGTESPAKQLETAQWSQDDPYNALVPKLNGQDCPVGCVVTAMAIILRYHQWPEKGTGTLPGYYWYSGDRYIDGYELDHRYDWSQMPLTYEKGKYTKEQAEQVAQLMYDLAVMSQMDFHSAGSSADANAPIWLATYFGYDKQIRYQDWDYYKRDAWELMIRDEIDAGRPVYYGGVGDVVGHAFVVDGYKGAYFSLNYGVGDGSGFYLLSPTVPLDKEALTAFCNWACMITHIYPDRGGEVYVNLSDNCLVPFPWDFRSKSFPVGGRGLIASSSSGKGAIRLAFVLYDREGRFKATTSDSVLVSTDEPYMPELTCNITCAIEDGDCLMLSQLSDGQWKPIQQSANAYLEFHPGHKLRELVSVGYSLGDPDDWDIEDAPCFSLRGAKDIYWEVWSEDRGVLLASSKSYYIAVLYEDAGYTMSSHWERATNEYRAVFHYPAGTYRILLRNFDEEMTLYVKL